MEITNHTTRKENIKHTTSYSDKFDTTQETTQESIHEIQQYFDYPLSGNSCCENQSHLFMLEKMS